ncbi:hypothetical protein FAES_0664 [Fibrella aestuarina BUZ 2]|uniref:DUF2279 domain-containing protein n=1 Tax=Fibrella aestuarina BUZ 2 TaxID=1166018 RepID=I0K3H2_9BACT|nr:DUF2279 domain-containing protein [Fibrella aestuarina]CCG98675.1 hypothetical protein FAES_0664 [Fibrella aestuarina BUZ 2]
MVTHRFRTYLLLGQLLIPLTSWAQDALYPPIPTDSTGSGQATYLATDSTAVTQRKRRQLLGGTTVLALGATYVYLENKWWREGYTRFHFDNGRDFRYASNVDKLGHLLGGVFTADAYYAGFSWAGMAPKRAAWYAAGAAAFVQLSIEFKDGFSPRYGFSWADVTAGTLGGLWPMAQQQSAFLRDSQWKASYWQRTDKYFDHRGIKTQAFSIDDYINQTYWFSFSPEHLGGHRFERVWPDWLQLSIGAGLEAETWSIGRTGEGGRWEWYLAPDIDLVKLVKPRRPLMKTVLHCLSYIKVPAPTLQIGPKPRFWWIYF